MRCIMKKNILSVALSVSLFLAVSCVRSGEIYNQDTYTYRFEIASESGADAKSVMNDKFVGWEIQDRIGFVLENDGNIVNNQCTVVDVLEPRPSFGFTTSIQMGEGDRILCFYPRLNAGYREWGYDGAVQHISIPLVQTHKLGRFEGKNMPMVSVPFTFTSDMLVGSNNQLEQIKFLNLGAMLDFKVFSSNSISQNEKVLDVIFEASENVAGAFAIDVQSINPSNEESLKIDLSDPVYTAEHQQPQSKIVRTESDAIVGTSSDDAGSVRMVVAPGTYTGKVKVRTDKAFYVFNITEAKTFARNGYYPLGLDLAKATSLVVKRMDQTQWQIQYCNSWEKHEDWRPERIYDGDFEKCWGNCWGTDLATEDDLDYEYFSFDWGIFCLKRRNVPDIAIVINMKQSVNVARIGIAKISADWPFNQDLKECEFYMADSFTFTSVNDGGSLENYDTVDDGNDWKPILTATDIPREPGVYWYDVPSSVSESDRTGQWLKIHPTGVYRGAEACQIGEILMDVIPTAEVQ